MGTYLQHIGHAKCFDTLHVDSQQYELHSFLLVKHTSNLIDKRKPPFKSQKPFMSRKFAVSLQNK